MEQFFGLAGKSVFMLVVLLTLSFAAQATPDNPADSKSKSFAVQSHNFQGNLIVFHYVCPFPGVTKVRLFDAEGNEIWRGQYNDEEGDNQVKFRSELLKSGQTYVFKFEYKHDNVMRTVSIP
ncbi:MAG: hypothetical protein H6581_19090 [Bacteroidia bacterium]|nr:hypothetical protein [Bacteroidia bacterium]